jgi:hypothetical protein
MHNPAADGLTLLCVLVPVIISLVLICYAVLTILVPVFIYRIMHRATQIEQQLRYLKETVRQSFPNAVFPEVEKCPMYPVK